MISPEDYKKSIESFEKCKFEGKIEGVKSIKSTEDGANYADIYVKMGEGLYFQGDSMKEGWTGGWSAFGIETIPQVGEQYYFLVNKTTNKIFTGSKTEYFTHFDVLDFAKVPVCESSELLQEKYENIKAASSGNEIFQSSFFPYFLGVLLVFIVAVGIILFKKRKKC